MNLYKLKFFLLTIITILKFVKTENNRVVCYYNSKSHFREGQAKFEVTDIEPALQFCTHLIYGYASINEQTLKLTPLNEQFDVIKDHYRQITNLKIRYPKLKVLLSVGGDEDVSGEGSEKNLKYRTVLETTLSRTAFTNSAYTLIKAFGFDGLDLAWEFPPNKPKKIRGTFGSIWHSIKKTVGGTTVIDELAHEHRNEFSALVRELRIAFRDDNLSLTLSVLPNVNSSVYYDPKLLGHDLEFINLLAYDFYTPERNPKEADYPAPLYELIDRKPDENVDAQVKYWLSNGCPSSKLVVGIATYGRAWKMTDESDANGMPPVKIDGPAEPGPLVKDTGLLSQAEICILTQGPKGVKGAISSQYKKVSDTTKRKGSYIYRTVDENNNDGIWIGYEDQESAGYKGAYVKAKALGGVAINDLSLDDYRGICGHDKYPILRSAKYQL